LINFVNVKPIGEVFTFLHSILGYCSPNISKEVNQSSLNVAAATAAIAFRPVLDKFTQFDLTFSALEVRGVFNVNVLHPYAAIL
jgi:hypothetical protein